MLLRSLLLAVALLVTMASTASAQSVTEVPAGSAFSVQNGSECAPNAQVELEFSQVGTVALGSTIADAMGHFEFDATLPAEATLGVAQVRAACGLEDVILVFDVVVVEASADGILGLSPLLLAILAGAVLLVAAAGWRVRAADATAQAEEAAQAEEGAEPEPSDAVAQIVGASETEHEPDYWFWDAVTERGKVRRVACLSELGFYLHEAPEEGFGTLLEVLAEHGPDAVFASSFVAIEIDAIDKVHRRGTQLRFVYTSNGELVARIVDLGGETDGVVDLLSRRVAVIAADELAAT